LEACYLGSSNCICLDASNDNFRNVFLYEAEASIFATSMVLPLGN
jgi:hypothetical protein